MAVPYVVFGLASVGIQITASHGPVFMPTETYDIEIRQKVTACLYIGVYKQNGQMSF